MTRSFCSTMNVKRSFTSPSERVSDIVAVAFTVKLLNGPSLSLPNNN